MRTALLSALAVLFIAAPAYAQETVMLPPAGTTIVNLSATERQKVSQDTLNASLRIEIDGATASEVQDKINKAMTEAVAESKKVSAVKVTTGNYHVYQYEDGRPDPKTGQIENPVKKWRGAQTIDLESKDSAKLLTLAGQIQEMGFAMNGLNYSLSTEKAEEVRDSLLTKAIEKLRAKAKVAQGALGKSGFEIVDVNIDNAAMPPVYPVAYKTMAMRGAADMAEMASPVAEAGESEVQMTVSARILLK